MASANITPTTVTIPNGGTADVHVNWTLDPGSPDQSGHLTLTLGGQTIFDGPITKQGRPAEQAPQIVLSNPQPGQALLSCDVATVSGLGGTDFRLT